MITKDRFLKDCTVHQSPIAILTPAPNPTGLLSRNLNLVTIMGIYSN